MACLQKISSDYLFNCSMSAAPVGQLGRYDEALLINIDDIDSFTTTSVDGVTIVLKEGTKGFKVSGVNNSIKVSIAKKGGDLYPNMVDPSIILTFPNSSLSSSADGIANVAMNASLVIALRGANGYTVFGLSAPLSCIDFEGDSTASEFMSVTYGVEDSQAGSTMYKTTKAEYDKWSAPAV